MADTSSGSATYAELVDSGSSRLHVVPSLSGGWVVREIADGPSLRRTNTRRGALNFATDMLFRGQGGKIEVHEPDGTGVDTYYVGAGGRRPWWYVPPRISVLVSGLLMVVVGLIDVWSYDHVMFWLGCVIATTGGAQVVSFTVSKRLDRRLTACAESEISLDTPPK